MRTTVITADPAGWTVAPFDHVATDDEITKAVEDCGVKVESIKHEDTFIPPERTIVVAWADRLGHRKTEVLIAMERD